MPTPPYDPRAVANLLLDIADRSEGGPLPITHIALQKLLYFAHGHHLIRSGKPLISGAFEAWTYGPVHPAVYREFRTEGKNPIHIRALSRDIMTGVATELPAPSDMQVYQLVAATVAAYGHLSPARLVEVSHAPKGPWWTVVNKAQTSVALGLRIPDNITVECFKYQKVAVAHPNEVRRLEEDTPLFGH